jgi:polyisoprenoid-binding protein YceI
MRHTFLSVIVFLAFLLSAVSVVNAQSYASKSFSLTIDGNSTMHEWSTAATNVQIKGDFVMPEGVLQKINSASVNVVTKSLKSTKKSGLMDSRTYETLKADAHPNITYVFTKVASIQQNGSETTLTINGNLTIGGTSKPTDLVIKMKTLPNGEIEVKGTRKIKMSEYGIKPPSFMLGALKVSDEVAINFSAVLQKK